MTEKRIRQLLEDIVLHLDYDLYESLFVEDCMKDREESEATVRTLCEIVDDYVN